MWDKNSDRSVKLWKTDGTFIKTLVEKTQELVNIRFSPDGQTLVTSVNDGAVTWWKADGTPINTLTENSKGYTPIWRFSPDNKTVALQNQKKIILWNRDGSKKTFNTEHKGDIYTVLFSPNGEMIATSSFDNTAKLWKPDGTLITTLTGDVTGLRFSADGKSLMTEGSKYTIVRRLEGMTDLDELLEEACKRMKVYLENSPNVQDSDRNLCKGISTQE